MKIRIGALIMAMVLSVTMLLGCSGKKDPPPNSEGESLSTSDSSDEFDSSDGESEQSNNEDDSSESKTSSNTGSNSTNNSSTGGKQNITVNKSLIPLTADGDGLLLENPDRGFRTEFVVDIKKAVDSGDAGGYIYKLFDTYLNTLGEPCKLMLAYVYITDYRNKELDDAAMSAIQALFDLSRNKKVKLMLRFAYCDSFLNLSTGANQTTIIRHIKQLAPIVSKNADVIHTISCGFVGAYGEWATVYQKPEVDYATVMQAIVKYLCQPNNIYFSIRLPKYKNLLSKSDPAYSWIGHNNDALFGAQNKKDWESEGYQLGSDEWNQVIKEGYLTPQDGEMFTSQNLDETKRRPSGMEVILETTQHRHTAMSFWHGYHDVGRNSNSIMSMWKKEYVTEDLLKQNKIVYCPSWFKNANGETVKRNAFEFIRDHLGYKIEAQKVAISGSNKTGSTANINMTLKNYGMSAVFNLESGFAILDSEYNVVSSVKAGNPKEWHSHSTSDYLNTTVLTHSVKADLKLPSKSGKYYVAFYLKNTMNDFARLSNKLETADGYNILHSFDL